MSYSGCALQLITRRAASNALQGQGKAFGLIEWDHGAMQGMIRGNVPDFGWGMEQRQDAEAAINQSGALTR